MHRKYDVVGGYIPSFVQHLKDTRARLGVRRGSQTNEDQVDATKANTLGSDWTPAEQDAFFRAVSVYSRWRPDLIAACVLTKTEWEVWMYLEALEDGAAALAEQQDDQGADAEDSQDVEMQVDSDSHSRSGSDANQDEDLCEPALEVSQTWVEVEERMASWIIEEEHLVSVEAHTASDTGKVDNKSKGRKRGRSPGAEKGRAQRRAREQTVSNNGTPPPAQLPVSSDPTSTSPCESSRDSSTFPVRKLEVLMTRLELPHLLALDSILREGEEAMREKSKSREGSATAASPTEHGDDDAPHDTDVSSLSDRITGPPETSNVPESSSNAVIDPASLAVCGGVDPPERHPGQVPSKDTATSPASVATQGSSSMPDAYPRPALLGVSSQLGMSQDDATASGPSLFSPRTRRRIQKRLYMRRRRARASDGAIDTGIEKLKPGKKAKSEGSEASLASTPAPCPEIPLDGEGESPDNAPKKNKSGLTLPYRLKAQFAELGVDAAYLHAQGMDLLNLGALGKLMGLYSSLEHAEAAGGSAIDAQLIRHLQAAMVSFVTDMIHRVIVWREREIRLKQRSQAWRHGEQITVGAVEHAVEAIGARYHSHKAYFKLLEASRGVSSAPEYATEEGPNGCVDPGAGADLPRGLPGLSPHRDVYTPLVCAPCMRPLACLAGTYEREATRTRRGTRADVDEDELMSDATDEDALEAALRVEDEVDRQDTARAAASEAALWDAIIT